MPNHVHFFFFNGGTSSITDAIRWYKSMSTNKYIHGVREKGWPRFDMRLWQTRFYDAIIRNEVAYSYVVNYILNNPLRWEYDRLNFDADVSKADDVSAQLRQMNW